jgi:hypothetical protein
VTGMLSKHEAQAWAEIERRLTGGGDRGSRSPERLLGSVSAQAVAPLLLAALAGLAGLPVLAFFLLFLAPVGFVVHMARNSPT